MSQLSRVAKHLRRNSKTGVTARKLAQLANTPLESVYKRVYDLRVNEGRRIYSNMRKTSDGTTRMFYRFAV